MIQVPINILLIDDEKDFVDILTLRLEGEGEKVLAAFDGQAGLALLAENEMIDVVILDIKMPGMDGIQVLRKIKANHPLVEVILLTGHGSTETAIRGMKLGAYDYLLKPADFEELKEKLTGARKKKEAQEERIRQAETRQLLRRSGNFF